MTDVNTDLDISKCLPPELCVTSAANHLYLIGLSHFKNGSQNRNKIHNPLLIAILNCVILLHNIFSLSLSEENPEIFIWIVDFSYFIKARIHFNVAFSFGLILTLISQYLHYMDFKNNKTPTYLKPFEMIEGLVSPQSIKFTDKVEIIKFIKLCQKWFTLSKTGILLNIIVLLVRVYCYL